MDGDYVVEMHDVLYRGASPGYFRLKIGELKFADLALPIGVTRGSAPKIQFASSNITDQLPVENVLVNEHSAATPASTATPGALNFSGSWPQLVRSDHPEILESPAGAKRQIVPAAPVGINGRLAVKGEEDQYLLNVRSGQKLRFRRALAACRRSARRCAGPTPRDGGELARNDDRNNIADPGLDYTVPGNVKKIVVALRDLQRRGR